MQMTAQAQAGQLPPGAPSGLPPGLLAGHPGAQAAAAAAAAAGLPTSLSLLAGIPTSLAQTGPNLPHPAFASLLAQQKPGAIPVTSVAEVVRSKEEEIKRAIESNGGGKSEKTSFVVISTRQRTFKSFWGEITKATNVCCLGNHIQSHERNDTKKLV